MSRYSRGGALSAAANRGRGGHACSSPKTVTLQRQVLEKKGNAEAGGFPKKHHFSVSCALCAGVAPELELPQKPSPYRAVSRYSRGGIPSTASNRGRVGHAFSSPKTVTFRRQVLEKKGSMKERTSPKTITLVVSVPGDATQRLHAGSTGSELRGRNSPNTITFRPGSWRQSRPRPEAQIGARERGASPKSITLGVRARGAEPSIEGCSATVRAM